jgi:hypothetical protein
MVLEKNDEKVIYPDANVFWNDISDYVKDVVGFIAYSFNLLYTQSTPAGSCTTWSTEYTILLWVST